MSNTLVGVQGSANSIMENNLLDFYIETRNHTQAICDHLDLSLYDQQPVAFVSPPKWHLGHTSWFFESFILEHFYDGYKVYNDEYGFVFNSYYESLGPRVDRAERGTMKFPSVPDVYEYRAYVDRHISDLLETNVLSEDIIKLLVTGCHHEQQHQELLLTDIKYILKETGQISKNPLLLSLEERVIDGKPGYIGISRGTYEIGHNGTGFSFDNERQRHKVYLNDFSISDRLVTNEDFLGFIGAGGYEDFSHWHSEGWEWVNENNINSPMYWRKKNDDWEEFTYAGWQPLEPLKPVAHISFFEAFAYAEWKGLRLPTEAEWEVASDQLDWGDRWEWTMSAYLPYPGYEKEEGALGEYNGKFMVNQMVLRGSSIATSEGHSRKTYRNFFHADERWQITGLRLAK